MPKRQCVMFYELRAHWLEYSAALRAAKALGLDVILLTRGDPADLTHLDGWVIRVERIDDTGGRDSAFAQGVELAQEYSAVGVVTWSDTDVHLVSRIAAHLGLPGPSEDAAIAARNKYRGRQLCKAADAGLVPAFALVKTAADLVEAMDELGERGILKPAAAAGSAGVTRIRNRSEGLEQLERLLAFARVDTHPLFKDGPGEVLFEKELLGTEHSVDGLVRNGECFIAAIVDKTVNESFIEITHVTPTALSVTDVRAVERHVKTVIAALQLDNCAFHLECKVDEGEVRLVEVAARPGGGNIASHLVGLTTGVDFYEEVIRLAIGAPASGARPFRRAFAATVKVVADAAGSFGGFPGIEGALLNGGLEAIAVHRSVGADIRVPPDDYAGALLATAVLSAGSRGVLIERIAQCRDALRPTMIL